MSTPARVSGPVSLGEYSIKRVIAASSVGTMIEWYDFYIFGSLAPVLALKFYPPGNETFAYIAYLATFAIGFIVRPFGALFFGHIGDLVCRLLLEKKKEPDITLLIHDAYQTYVAGDLIVPLLDLRI